MDCYCLALIGQQNKPAPGKQNKGYSPTLLHNICHEKVLYFKVKINTNRYEKERTCSCSDERRC